MVTKFSRRQILAAGISAAGFTATPFVCAKLTANSGSSLLISAADIQREHFVVATDELGNLKFQVRLPFRGHEALVTPDRQWLIVLPRRPGRIGAKLRLSEPDSVLLFDAGQGRHFYGHAVLTYDGDHLISSDNDYEMGRGVLSVRRLDDLTVVSEMDSGGLGPHQIAWLSDGKTLAVANGGILTHPDKPRKKLNLDSMQPNLSLVEVESGTVTQQFDSPSHQSSMRHLDVSRNDDVVVGLQHEGDPMETVPLVVVARQSGKLEVLPQPAIETLNMKQYIASVVVDPVTSLVAVTSPRGHQIAFWDLENSSYLGQTRMRDVSGLAARLDGAGFLASTGMGRVQHFPSVTSSVEPSAVLKTPGVQWDNHLLLLEGYRST